MKTIDLTALQMGLLLGRLCGRHIITFSDIPEILHDDLITFLAFWYNCPKDEINKSSSFPSVTYIKWFFKIKEKGFDYPIQWVNEPQKQPKQ
jgi:hypothetical protein